MIFKRERKPRAEWKLTKANVARLLAGAGECRATYHRSYRVKGWGYWKPGFRVLDSDQVRYPFMVIFETAGVLHSSPGTVQDTLKRWQGLLNNEWRCYWMESKLYLEAYGTPPEPEPASPSSSP